MKWILFFLLSAPAILIAQNSSLSQQVTGNTGIIFERGLSWDDIKLKAKAEGKPIFMDCYATWCGPCKFMSQNIFTQKAVGDFMNKNFISVAVQMDRTAKDGEEIKKWYLDATSIGSTYFINEYPTYLYFGPDGQPLHRVVGATGSDPMSFIVKAREALDSNQQYYTGIEKSKLHLHDSVFLRHELMTALQLGDVKGSECLSNAYFDCIEDPFNVETINLIRYAMQSSQDRGFQFFLNNLSKLDSTLHEQGMAERTIGKIIENEEIAPLFRNSRSVINWSKIKETIMQKYLAANSAVIQTIYQAYEIDIVNKMLRGPLYHDSTSTPSWNRIVMQIKKKCLAYNPDSIIVMEKPRFYADRKLWSLCDRATIICLKKYGNKLDTYDLNSILWDLVFMRSNNPRLLSIGVKMARRMVPDLSDTIACRKSEVYNYMDTYANLLYKTGSKKQAILWEQGALRAVESNVRINRSDEVNLKTTITKMQNGERTWVGRTGGSEEFR
ncbi:MAG TPA: DUF255 domain-containing protein [Puia sp.]|nr:DUF255 domain-containing protein [Puia sp.]